MENYFEFYGLEVRFQIDENQLRQQFLSISKEYHPDFFINVEEEYENALEMTSLNNKAFKTLTDATLRTKHILDLNNMLSEKEQMPAEFLMEMMDINEAIMDLKLDPDESKMNEVLLEVKAFEDQLSQNMQSLAAKFDNGDDTVLIRIKENYLKQKYLRRIKENLAAD